MKRTILITVFLIGISQVFGQSLHDTIEIVYSSGAQYYLNEKKLHLKDIQKLTLSNEAAWNEILAARRNSSTASILSISGGILLGSHLILLISHQGSIPIAGILGTGLILGSMPFFVLKGKHSIRGVSIYNKGIKQKTLKNQDISLGFTSSGLGILMTF